MPLHVERVVNGRVDGNKALSRFDWFEALHLSFTSSNRLMRVFCAVVGAQSLLVRTREANFAKCRSVGSQFISDNNRRNEALATKEFPDQAQCRGLVALRMNENFKDLTFAIDSAPHVHLLSRERDHQSSGPGELHPQALTDPYPAPTVQPLPGIALSNVQKVLAPDA